MKYTLIKNQYGTVYGRAYYAAPGTTQWNVAQEWAYESQQRGDVWSQVEVYDLSEAPADAQEVPAEWVSSADADAEPGDPFARFEDDGRYSASAAHCISLEVRPYDSAAMRYSFPISAFERAFDLVVTSDDPIHYEVEPGEWVRIDDPLAWEEAVKARAAR